MDIGIGKDGMPIGHKYLAILVKDKDTFQIHKFIIQRVPSKFSLSAQFSYFCQFPDSTIVLDKLEKAIKNMQSVTRQAADSISAAINAAETSPFNSPQ
jgi:hypothetical protein